MRWPPLAPRPARRSLAWMALALLALVAVLGHAVWLSAIASALVAADPPAPADAIIVLAGSSPYRLQHGLELYRAGYAPRLVISDEEIKSHGLATTWSALLRQGLVKLDVPPQALEILSPSSSTYEEALKSRDLMLSRGYRTALLVTDEFHSRRALMVFTHVFTPAGLSARVSPSRNPEQDVQRWWEDEERIAAIALEYVKFVHYAVRGRLF